MTLTTFPQLKAYWWNAAAKGARQRVTVNLGYFKSASCPHRLETMRFKLIVAGGQAQVE